MKLAIRIANIALLAGIIGPAVAIALSNNPNAMAAALIFMTIGTPCLFGVRLTLDEEAR